MAKSQCASGTSHPTPELEYTIQDAQADTVLFHHSFRDRIIPLQKRLGSVEWIETHDLAPQNTTSPISVRS